MPQYRYRRSAWNKLFLAGTSALVAFDLTQAALAQDAAGSNTATNNTAAATEETSSTATAVLPPLIVQDELTYSGAIDGYLAPGSDTGLKAGVPINEVPQSISVVTSTELEERKPQKVDDAIKYVAGVTSGNWGNDPRFDQFSMRGFDLGTGSLYRDGLPQKSLGMNGFQTDPYMLDRVDVLRGPAGVLYGSNDAGGMVNMVTKRPTFDHLGEIQTSYGSYGTKELGLDVSDALNSQGTLAGRITGLARDGSTALHGSDNDRSLLAGGLTWAPDDDTSITLLSHVQSDSLPQFISVPVAGEDYDTSLGELPDDFYRRQSDFNRFTTQQRSAGWDATHNFSDAVTFNQKFRYGYQKTHTAQLDLNYADVDGVHYYSYDRRAESETYGIDNNVEFKQSVPGGKNSLVTGFDMQHSWTNETAYDGTDDYVVSYTNPSFDFPVDDLALSDRTRETYSESGLYLQDHLKLNNGVMITGGLRHSWLKSATESLVNDTYDDQSDQATTGLVGVSYDLGNGYVPYVSYTEGFTQNVGTTIDGQTLDPSKSRQWEAGVRYTPEVLPLSVSAAVFELRKTNVKDYDLDDPTYSTFTQAGEIRSRGLELELRGELTRHLQGVANYAYLDSEITKNADESLVGNSSAFAPRNQVSFWLDYDAKDMLEGLSFGAGARYISSTFDSQENARRTPGYTLADLAAHYEIATYTLSLNVSNLFDREYYGTCIESYGCIMGEGRTAKLTLSKKF